MLKPINEIISDIDLSTQSLIECTERVPENIFNSKPSENSWSPGDILEHLMIIEGYVNSLYTGETKKCVRNPLLQIEKIEKTFMDFQKKYSAQGPVIPSKNEKIKQTILTQITKSRTAFVEAVKLHDLTEICLGYEHFFFGQMTRVEWIYFNIYHSKRHIRQIENTVVLTQQPIINLS